MADFPSFEELFRVARDEALTRSSNLTRTVIERKGSDANAMVAAGVAIGDTVVGQLTRLSAALFISTAKKEDLDRLVFDRYQMLRNPASPARVDVQLTTTIPAVAGFTIPVGTQFKTSDGKLFSSTEQRVYPTGSSGPIVVPAQSVLAGLSQQIAVGRITSATIVGAPADLTVTNLAASAGADDEEDDAHLRDRAQRFYTTSQRGTLAAIERAALDVAGVRKAFAYETTESDGSPARIVQLAISDAYTDELVDAAVLPGGYKTQASTLALYVQSKLLDVRAAGIYVMVQIAQVRMMGITLLPRFRAGSDVAAASAGARAVAVSYVNSLAPGQTFVVDDLDALLQTVPGLNVLGGEVVAPSDDQTALPLQVWRTSMDRVVVGSL